MHSFPLYESVFDLQEHALLAALWVFCLILQASTGGICSILRANDSRT